MLPGKIQSFRIAGPRLIFLDVFQLALKIQCVINVNAMNAVNENKFRNFYRLVKKGDAFSQ
jgi:lysyl-tRNA synthetase class 2